MKNQSNSKDNSKYKFNNAVYGKGQLVLAVIRKYIEDNNPKLEEILNEFSKKKLSNNECLISQDQHKIRKTNSNDAKKRFFENSDDILTTNGGDKVLVSNQWSKNNIDIFINYVDKYGYKIDKVNDDLSLIELFEIYIKNPSSEWIKQYNQVYEQVLKYKNNQPEEFDLPFIKNLWKTVKNGVSSVSPGSLSEKEYNKLLPELPDITKRILELPTTETLSYVYKWANQAKKDSKFTTIKRSVINRVFSAINPDEISTILNNDALGKFIDELNHSYSLNIPQSSNWIDRNIALKRELTEHGVPNNDPILVNTFIWYLYEKLKITNEESTDNLIDSETKNNNGIHSMKNSPLNQILYGPPGTGKTYHSIDTAVQAAEPTFDLHNATRNQIKQKYDELVSDGRIRFVTFHQSYGYEQFVEGLSAQTEGGQISYDVMPGVFKQICDKAKMFSQSKTVKNSDNFDMCWDEFLEQLEDSENGIKVPTVSGKSFINIYDINNETIRFDKKVGKSTHSLKVSTLKSIFNQERELKGGLSGYYQALIKFLKQLITDDSNTELKRENFVLIIDEINRGNISKIFGELITLLEPSKRKGQPESVELVLPYSNEPFSVPDNLYIIGTMNTADRSLAMMDTALRRRFDFVEMMPQPELFSGKIVNGIELDKMLEAINKRIEVLYDREHTLGHAFFMPVVEKMNGKDQNQKEAFIKLQNVFKNKIIPLLEEYFFEDWNKIRLVLGDNHKESSLLSQYEFVKTQTYKYSDIFGKNHCLETYEDKTTTYKLADFDDENSAWHEKIAYQAIYDTNVLPKEKKDSDLKNEASN
ncbi:McrB family protein [Marinicellulosiphila megalodicopiae]|uniref:McrB family protein n=1 Tax=Marinicellulosiphila megalodicopiae TaxID=2724896 RepID=UPI003BB096B2